jgi:hypothetical protein
MKTRLKVLCALALVAGVAHAAVENKQDDQAAAPKEAKVKSPASATEQKAVAKPKKLKVKQRTGSNVARCIHRYGMITDGPNNLVIIDQNMIRQSGASSVAQVLNRYGARH